ncbi:phasin family protein [Geminicoccus roseus]|uniref:phasin family protein n=1 Tax=Geminicoccus roseus TaxID=404900 RepID=UPI0003FE6025|nr:phasin family protein [Geminicoccus roseus]
MTAIDALFSTAGRNSSQTSELAYASTEVVLHRMRLGGIAAVDPANADHREFARMLPEKVRAFQDAGSVLLGHSTQMGQEMAKLMVDEARHAAASATAVLTSGSPAGMLAAQASAAMSFAERLVAQAGALWQMSLDAQAAAVAPIHRAATDNVARLRG